MAAARPGSRETQLARKPGQPTSSDDFPVGERRRTRLSVKISWKARSSFLVPGDHKVRKRRTEVRRGSGRTGFQVDGQGLQYQVGKTGLPLRGSAVQGLPAGGKLKGQPGAVAEVGPDVRRPVLEVMQGLFNVIRGGLVQTGRDTFSELG